MKLAESKRALLYNEQYNYTAGLGAGDANYDTYLSNAILALNTGSQDNQLIGNAILSPLLVLRGTIRVNWLAIIGSTGFIPTYRVDITLIATNDQFSSSNVARITSIAEDNTLYLRHVTTDLRWQFNSQSVTVIKRKTIMFNPHNVTFPGGSGASPMEVRPFKITKRLKGTKEFESEYTAGGTYTTTPFLKGWNYYWVVTSACSNTIGTAVVGGNPIQITGDRYMYFKDF